MLNSVGSVGAMTPMLDYATIRSDFKHSLKDASVTEAEIQDFIKAWSGYGNDNDLALINSASAIIKAKLYAHEESILDATPGAQALRDLLTLYHTMHGFHGDDHEKWGHATESGAAHKVPLDWGEDIPGQIGNSISHDWLRRQSGGEMPTGARSPLGLMHSYLSRMLHDERTMENMPENLSELTGTDVTRDDLLDSLKSLHSFSENPITSDVPSEDLTRAYDKLKRVVHGMGSEAGLFEGKNPQDIVDNAVMDGYIHPKDKHELLSAVSKLSDPNAEFPNQQNQLQGDSYENKKMTDALHRMVIGNIYGDRSRHTPFSSSAMQSIREMEDPSYGRRWPDNTEAIAGPNANPLMKAVNNVLLRPDLSEDDHEQAMENQIDLKAWQWNALQQVMTHPSPLIRSRYNWMEGREPGDYSGHKSPGHVDIHPTEVDLPDGSKKTVYAFRGPYVNADIDYAGHIIDRSDPMARQRLQLEGQDDRISTRPSSQSYHHGQKFQFLDRVAQWIVDNEPESYMFTSENKPVGPKHERYYANRGQIYNWLLNQNDENSLQSQNPELFYKAQAAAARDWAEGDGDNVGMQDFFLGSEFASPDVRDRISALYSKASGLIHDSNASYGFANNITPDMLESLGFAQGGARLPHLGQIMSFIDNHDTNNAYDANTKLFNEDGTLHEDIRSHEIFPAACMKEIARLKTGFAWGEANDDEGMKKDCQKKLESWRNSLGSIMGHQQQEGRIDARTTLPIVPINLLFKAIDENGHMTGHNAFRNLSHRVPQFAEWFTRAGWLGTPNMGATNQVFDGQHFGSAPFNFEATPDDGITHTATWNLLNHQPYLGGGGGGTIEGLRSTLKTILGPGFHAPKSEENPSLLQMMMSRPYAHDEERHKLEDGTHYSQFIKDSIGADLPTFLLDWLAPISRSVSSRVGASKKLSANMRHAHTLFPQLVEDGDTAPERAGRMEIERLKEFLPKTSGEGDDLWADRLALSDTAFPYHGSRIGFYRDDPANIYSEDDVRLGSHHNHGMIHATSKYGRSDEDAVASRSGARITRYDWLNMILPLILGFHSPTMSLNNPLGTHEHTRSMMRELFNGAYGTGNATDNTLINALATRSRTLGSPITEPTYDMIEDLFERMPNDPYRWKFKKDELEYDEDGDIMGLPPTLQDAIKSRINHPEITLPINQINREYRLGVASEKVGNFLEGENGLLTNPDNPRRDFAMSRLGRLMGEGSEEIIQDLFSGDERRIDAALAHGNVFDILHQYAAEQEGVLDRSTGEIIDSDSQRGTPESPTAMFGNRRWRANTAMDSHMGFRHMDGEMQILPIAEQQMGRLLHEAGALLRGHSEERVKAGEPQETHTDEDGDYLHDTVANRIRVARMLEEREMAAQHPPFNSMERGGETPTTLSVFSNPVLRRMYGTTQQGTVRNDSQHLHQVMGHIAPHPDGENFVGQMSHVPIQLNDRHEDSHEILPHDSMFGSGVMPIDFKTDVSTNPYNNTDPNNMQQWAGNENVHLQQYLVKSERQKIVDNRPKDFIVPNKPAFRLYNISDMGHLRGFSGQWVVQQKWPGIRVQVHKKGPLLRIYDSTGKEITNSFDKADIRRANSDSYIVDGMAVFKGEKGRDALIEHLEKEADLPNGKLVIHVVDIIEHNRNDVSTLDLESRIKLLKIEFESIGDVIEFPSSHDTIFTHSIEETEKVAQKFFNEKHSEGAMLKDATSSYMKGVKSNPKWVKWKKNEELDVIILAVSKGRYRVGVGPLGDEYAEDIGSASVEYEGHHYMDIGTILNVDGKQKPGTILRIAVGGVNRKAKNNRMLYTVSAPTFVEVPHTNTPDRVNSVKMLAHHADPEVEKSYMELEIGQDDLIINFASHEHDGMVSLFTKAGIMSHYLTNDVIYAQEVMGTRHLWEGDVQIAFKKAITPEPGEEEPDDLPAFHLEQAFKLLQNNGGKPMSLREIYESLYTHGHIEDVTHPVKKPDFPSFARWMETARKRSIDIEPVNESDDWVNPNTLYHIPDDADYKLGELVKRANELVKVLEKGMGFSGMFGTGISTRETYNPGFISGNRPTGATEIEGEESALDFAGSKYSKVDRMREASKNALDALQNVTADDDDDKEKKPLEAEIKITDDEAEMIVRAEFPATLYKTPPEMQAGTYALYDNGNSGAIVMTVGDSEFAWVIKNSNQVPWDSIIDTHEKLFAEPVEPSTTGDVIEKGRFKMGSQRKDYHEYFFDGSMLKGKYVFKILPNKEGTLLWHAWRGKEQTPTDPNEHDEGDWNPIENANLNAATIE